jgi:hypothetical protein
MNLDRRTQPQEWRNLLKYPKNLINYGTNYAMTQPKCAPTAKATTKHSNLLAELVKTGRAN